MQTTLKRRTRRSPGASKKVLYRKCPKVTKPSFGNVQISHSGLNVSKLMAYQYDPAGNRTAKSVTTDAGVQQSEALTYNNLNQLTQRVVTTPSGVVTWTYSYDLSGNMVSKSDGTDTWTFSFSDENRLDLATLNGVPQVAYSYDLDGRMLSRTSYVGGVAQAPSTFIWDHMDLVQEVDGPTGVSTSYFCPRGKLSSISRAGQSYQVHYDALGTVRAITNSVGAVVSHWEYTAWGEQLPTSVDGLPGGFNYGFIGGLGVRVDPVTGFYYMRARHYDSELGRFLSRDPIGSDNNLYGYCLNSPVDFNDPYGLQPGPGQSWGQWMAQLTREGNEAAELFGDLLAHKLGITPDIWFKINRGAGPGSGIRPDFSFPLAKFLAEFKISDRLSTVSRGVSQIDRYLRNVYAYLWDRKLCRVIQLPAGETMALRIHRIERYAEIVAKELRPAVEALKTAGKIFSFIGQPLSIIGDLFGEKEYQYVPGSPITGPVPSVFPFEFILITGTENP